MDNIIFTDKKTERKTSIELLRIICMLMIVSSHAIIHGGFSEFPNSLNGVVSIFFTQGSRIGVNVFVILTGFFSVGHKTNFNKIKWQYLQVMSYSLVLSASLLFIGEIQLEPKSIINAIFPISTEQYWFATSYLLLLLFSPCLQICVEKFTQLQYHFFLVVFGILWSVLPTLYIGNPGYNKYTVNH